MCIHTSRPFSPSLVCRDTKVYFHLGLARTGMDDTVAAIGPFPLCETTLRHCVCCWALMLTGDEASPSSPGMRSCPCVFAPALDDVPISLAVGRGHEQEKKNPP